MAADIVPAPQPVPADSWVIRFAPEHGTIADARAANFAELTAIVAEARRLNPDVELYIVAPSRGAILNELGRAADRVIAAVGDPAWPGPPLGDPFFGGLKSFDQIHQRLRGVALEYGHYELLAIVRLAARRICQRFHLPDHIPTITQKVAPARPPGLSYAERKRRRRARLERERRDRLRRPHDADPGDGWRRHVWLTFVPGPDPRLDHMLPVRPEDCGQDLGDYANARGW